MACTRIDLFEQEDSRHQGRGRQRAIGKLSPAIYLLGERTSAHEGPSAVNQLGESQSAGECSGGPLNAATAQQLPPTVRRTTIHQRACGAGHHRDRAKNKGRGDSDRRRSRDVCRVTELSGLVGAPAVSRVVGGKWRRCDPFRRQST